MTISSPAQLVNALANNSDPVVIDKASIANATAAAYMSLWRASGQPGQGAIPTTAAACTKALTGAFPFNNPTSPVSTYLGWMYLNSSNAAMSPEIHDRLAHIGGLVLNSTTSQAAVLDPTALSAAADRIGESNYSNVQWWLEVYADGGATASNATINVTYSDASTGDLTVVPVGGTLRASRMIPLNGLIPAAKSGLYITKINSVINSASTGTAGNFGFTATRQRTVCPLDVAGKSQVFDWAQLGVGNVPNDACLSVIMLTSTTSTGTLRGGAKLAHG